MHEDKPLHPIYDEDETWDEVKRAISIEMVRRVNVYFHGIFPQKHGMWERMEDRVMEHVLSGPITVNNPDLHGKFVLRKYGRVINNAYARFKPEKLHGVFTRAMTLQGNVYSDKEPLLNKPTHYQDHPQGLVNRLLQDVAEWDFITQHIIDNALHVPNQLDEAIRSHFSEEDYTTNITMIGINDFHFIEHIRGQTDKKASQYLSHHIAPLMVPFMEEYAYNFARFEAGRIYRKGSQ